MFKIKDEQDGSKRKKSRIVTKGFLQIPGIDFKESYSPVATDASVRIIFGISMYFAEHGDKDEWICEVFDVEAAFLNTALNIKMYIEIPECMEVLGFVRPGDREKYAIELGMLMYGNVDAALLFFKTFKGILKELGLTQSLADPCVFYKKDDSGKINLVIATHVDDSAVSGRKTVVEKFLDDFEKHLKIERLGKLKKHLGIWWEWKKDLNGQISLEGKMRKMATEIMKSY